MAHSESEIFYESGKELPKIDQSDFCTESEEVEIYNLDALLNHIKSLEPLYHDHFEINNNRPDSRVCNEILFSCTKMFEHEINICVIYNEIVDYFGFDNERYYSCLNNQFKKRLRTALSKRIPINYFEKQQKIEEAKFGGAFTPRFSSMKK